ncbi:MAG: rhomboid family intramembrane serine protease [Myxococcota bacterium]
MHGRGYQTGGFGPPFTPPIVQQLLIVNAVAFVAQILVPAIGFYGAVRPDAVWQYGHLYQPFTYMWLHGGIGHLLMNLFVLWMFGSQLAMAWGAKRFLRYYLLCGVGAGFIISLVPYLLMAIGIPSAIHIGTVGASGAIYGLLLAYSLTWPDRTIALIFPPVAFRAIWLIPIVFFMTVAFGGGNISHVGHLGGVLVGWIYMRRQGEGRNLLSLEQIKYKWRRYRMRQKLRAIQYEEFERRRDDDKRMH